MSQAIGVHYTKSIVKYDSSNAIRDLKITEAEFYWDIDPGQTVELVCWF